MAGSVATMFRGLKRLTLIKRPQDVQATRDAIRELGPNLLSAIFSPDRWFRYKTSLKAFDIASTPEERQSYAKAAKDNLKKWPNKPIVRPLPLSVEVTPRDWGDEALKLAQEHGVSPAILVAASGEIPLGAFPEGLAHEEDFGRRTTAPGALVRAFRAPQKSTNFNHYLYDSSHKGFYYTPEERLRMIGAAPMSTKQLAKLNEACGTDLTKAYEVYRHPRPILYLFGPEQRLRVDTADHAQYPDARHTGFIIDQHHSYLPQPTIPLVGVFAAAPMLADGNITRPSHDGGGDVPVDWEDMEFKKVWRKDMSRRIAAILDTMIVNGDKHAILPAWGCGVYGNKPEKVAEIFKEELLKRPGLFKTVKFAVRVAPGLNESHYEIFKDVLHGTPLVSDAKSITFFKPSQKVANPLEEEPQNKTLPGNK